MVRFLTFIGVWVLLLLAAALSQAAVMYTVTELGNFSPKAINNRGDVVGLFSTALNEIHGVLCSISDNHIILTDLGTLGGTYTYASDINDNGQVVGYSEMSDGSLHAFLYSNGKMTDLGDFGGKNIYADGINNIGQIAASYEAADGVKHAILYDHGSITDLGNLGGNVTAASAINSKGEIAGSATKINGTLHAYIYSQGVMSDLDTPGASHAAAINDAEQIVGDWCSPNIPIHAYLYTNGSISDISAFSDGTAASDINESGDIVGDNLSNNKAFIYHNNELKYLNDLIDPTSGVNITHANGINDSGQIVAYGYNNELNGSAYLLTPIPEPSSMVQLFIGITGIFIYIWFWKRG